MRFNSRILRIFFIVIAVILFVAATVLVITGVNRVRETSSADTEIYTATDYMKRMQGILIDGEYYHKKTGIKTFLFIGLDKTGPIVSSSSYKNLNNADFLLLAVVNSEKKTINLIEIDRDTMTNIRRLDLFGRAIGPIYAQIALSYSYGDGLETSAMNTVNTVGDFFYGLDIDYYFAVNMDGAVSILDLFGEIPVLLNNDYTDIDSSYYKGRVVSMNAEEALSFIRARRGLENPTNQARVERQKLYINAIADRLTVVDFPSVELSEYLKNDNGLSVTNISFSAASELYAALEKYTVKNVVSLPGEVVEGEEHMEFYPDSETLKALCLEVLYDKY